MINVGIIGASGYTGSELVRILAMHPEVKIQAITSESHQGKLLSSIHPQFNKLFDLPLVSVEHLYKYSLDIVFLALPHGISMQYVKEMKGKGLKIIDLSGDFRLASSDVYEEWYHKKHVFPEGFKKSTYGLPELYRTQITDSSLIANPGCYPTSALLGSLPLVAQSTTKLDEIIIDAKSGVTGAGIKAKAVNHFSTVNDNFKSYGLKTHRHTIEIEENLSKAAGKPVKVQFTPHLLPIDRGILSTIYVRTSKAFTDKELYDYFTAFYREHPFVRVREQAPSLKDVRATNFCDLFATYDDRTGRVIVISVIDNLVKGAAGQAVHNLNLIAGYEETLGLAAIPLNP